MTISIERARDLLADTKWTHPADYAGHLTAGGLSWCQGDYVIYARTRETSILEDVNYQGILDALNRIAWNVDSGVYVFRANHWACGWVEYIMLPHDAPEVAIIAAAQIIAALADYPCLDDCAYSVAQHEAMGEYWERCSIEDRIGWCQEAGASIFSARHDHFPELVMDNFHYRGMFN